MRWNNKQLSSDETGHSLNRYYWNASFPHTNSTTWNVNDPIAISVIISTVLSMKNNKTPGTDGIQIEFYKAIFCNSE